MLERRRGDLDPASATPLWMFMIGSVFCQPSLRANPGSRAAGDSEPEDDNVLGIRAFGVMLGSSVALRSGRRRAVEALRSLPR